MLSELKGSFELAPGDISVENLCEKDLEQEFGTNMLLIHGLILPLTYLC